MLVVAATGHKEVVINGIMEVQIRRHCPCGHKGIASTVMIEKPMVWGWSLYYTVTKVGCAVSNSN